MTSQQLFCLLALVVAAPVALADEATRPAERSGFAVRTTEAGATWLFYAPSKELAAFDAGEKMSDKHVTRINYRMGGRRVTTKAPDAEIFTAYEAAKPGFVARFFGEGRMRRLWVFKADAPELKTLLGGGELAKHVGRISHGATVKAPDQATLDAYFATRAPHARTGFAVRTNAQGETWLFYEPSAELTAFDAGEKMSDKHVTRINYPMAGQRVTTKAPDAEIFAAYEAARPGFVARYFGKAPVRRLWIFKVGAPELKTMLGGGELAKHVARIGSGQTLRFPDAETREAYLGK